MTEYKKLCVLVSELSDAVARLTQAHADATAGGVEPDATELHVWVSLIESHIASGHPRLLKILRKALETDPDRQIYNEAMCGRIQELFDAYCAAVGILCGHDVRDALLSDSTSSSSSSFSFSSSSAAALLDAAAPLVWASALHDALLLRTAQTDAWRQRCARGLADVVRFADETRDVHCAEERSARAALLRSAQQQLAAVRRLLEERAAAQWRAELSRRAEESDALSARAKEWRAAVLPISIVPVVPLFFIRIRQRLLRLVRALRAAPEDPNIRRIRCNNAAVVADFGHAALAAGCADCASAVAAAEALWAALGYRVEYAEPPPQPLRIDAGEQEMVCGRPAAAHKVYPLAYERYAERFFVMREPDPAKDGAAWMEWYDRLEEIAQFLESCSN